MSSMSSTLFLVPPVLMAGTLLVATSLKGAPLPVGDTVAATSSPTISSRAVFDRRIRPLLDAKNPSSCAQCHLSGVDLKSYIRPSESETFAALREQGMLDVERPEDSRILKFIRMSRPQTPLVTQQVRDLEYTAFSDWIIAAVKDPNMAKAKVAKSASPAGPTVPNAVIRHTRLDSVVASFERNVWSQEGRCMNCHRPDNAANIKKYGERVSWFVPGDPEATMGRLIAQGDVDVEKPEESLLLLKPLNKVAHGGGVKMLYGDAGYKMLRAWLVDYAASVKGNYRTVEELPAIPGQSLVNMDTIMNLTNGPADWADKLLRVDVYPWDKDRNAWAPKPIATGERGMFGGKDTPTTSTNLIMFQIVPERDAKQAQIQAKELRTRIGTGRYLLKYYCDTAGKLNQDYTIPTDSPAFYQGQQEITASRWFGGWGAPVKVSVAPTKPATEVAVKQP